MAEVGEPDSSAQDDSASSEEDSGLDYDWFDAGGDDYDFEKIDYHKSSSTKWYVMAIVGFLGLGSI